MKKAILLNFKDDMIYNNFDTRGIPYDSGEVWRMIVDTFYRLYPDVDVVWVYQKGSQDIADKDVLEAWTEAKRQVWNFIEQTKLEYEDMQG